MEQLERRVFLSAGDLDPSFGLGGIAGVNVPGTDSERVTVVDVANGRVVLGGIVPAQSGTSNTQSRVALAVLDSAGQPLKSFSGDGIETELLQAPGGVLDLALQPADNKIVVLAGDPQNPTSHNVVARFNTNGTLDTTFGGGDGQIIVGFGTDLALAPNGRIVVAAGQQDNTIAVARFTSSGAAYGQTLVRAGAAGTGNFAHVSDVAVQADGKVVVSGSVTESNGFNIDAVVVRVRSDITGLDTSYGGGDGVVSYDSNEFTDDFDSVDALTLDSQGRAVIALRLASGHLGLRRLLATSGSEDGSFEAGGYGTDGFQYQGAGARSINVASGGKIVVSGASWYEGDIVLRFNANGTIDTSFGGGDGDLQSLFADTEPVAGPFSDVLPDGRIVSAGGYTRFDAFRHVADNTTPVGSAVLGTDRVLRVTGTEAGHDDVRVSDFGASDPEGPPTAVYVNGRTSYFRKRDVDRIEIKTLGGNDRVSDVDLAEAGAISIATRRIDGGAGNDELHGGRGKDTILGQSGNDRIFGNGGDDLLDGGQGTDLMDGGSGADTVDYHFRNSAVFVDLQGDADDGPAGERDTVGANVEHIIGGNGSDTLIGNSLPNHIRGGPGNDTIRGGGGNDTLQGDGGRDSLYGEAGDDFLDAKDGITDLVLDGGTEFDRARKDASDPRSNIEQVLA
jgi:uncharacterized delta-60 repeat protein